VIETVGRGERAFSGVVAVLVRQSLAVPR